ncbi:purine-nucleoside phosphorylase [uncultured Oscillibacter sp.]|jgi:purine-nucleoside phosphorylase|uniref:purine-nucleoside phosphorylase n=1 Tax=uncultured Oscillibacter sp. TaxID=876091 RepID=UPI0028039B3C|nr:purine-nucleoside phosphorylase [uncultured Oscillibacter sp.]
MDCNYVQEAAEYVRARIGETPRIGLILGSGLGGIAEVIEDKHVIPYGEIPHFVCSTAPGHKGQFVAGRFGGKPVICMQGRLHFYEGHALSDIIFPVRVMKQLGVTSLIVTNAAGGINTSFQVGDLMLIEDHINFMGTNPLIGPNDASFGPRFCDMTYTYTPALRQAAQEAAQSLGLTLQKGVYLGCTGPSYETPAEIRAFRTLGADAVGMSTVPEVIAASHCGLQVLAFSLITNMAAGILDQPLTEEEVIEIGNRRGSDLQRLITRIVTDCSAL